MTQGKYWTAFRLDGEDPNKLHCTHKYLGDLPNTPVADELEIELTISQYFAAHPLMPLRLVFDEPAMFGEAADVAVLVGDGPTAKLTAYDGLRSQLGQFRDDDHPEYLPHVTTNLSRVDARITGYVLMCDKEIIREWPAFKMANAGPYTVLPAIKETSEDYEPLEKEILRAFREILYHPLLHILGRAPARLRNAKPDALREAIESRRVTFNRGVFRGSFNAQISRRLRELGAAWDKGTATYRLETSLLPQEIREAVAASLDRFERVTERLDRELRQNLPAEIAGTVQAQPILDKALWKIDRKVDNSLEAIALLPKLTPERRTKISAEWTNNLDKWIKDFAAEEIPWLRDQVQKHVLSGGRYEDIVGTLRESFGVTERKARFLARQETGLLMAKFKETRYTEAGVDEYQWQCVAGSAAHPVRPSHKILDGKIFRWDDPPITTAPDQPVRRCNPGEDFNCRCGAKPVVRGLRKQAV